MAYNPDHENDPDNLRRFLARTKEAHPDLYNRAFRRLCKLTKRDADDPLEAEFDGCVAALEQIYFEESGRRKRASRITRKREKDGLLETFRYLAMKSEPSDGFKHLVNHGLAEFTAEHVVLRYPDRFPLEAVEASRRRLMEHGIPIPSGLESEVPTP
jgi:hypothetical protein